MPKVSIIILTYNSEKHIKELLDSIYKQSYRDFEIVLVDNASSDTTLNIVKNNYSNVIIIQNNENYWYAKGNNIGISKAKGEYILICNDDVKLDEKYLEKSINVLEKNNKTAAVCGKVYKLTDSTNFGILDGVGIKTNAYRKFENIGENQVDNGQFSEEKSVFGISGALFLARKKAFNDICLNNEYFDEDFVAYKEDIDLSYRFRLRGWKMVYTPEAIAWHKRSIDKGDLKARKKKNKIIKAYSYRNHWWTLVKNESVINLFLLGSFIFIYELFKFIYLLIFETNTIIFCIREIKKFKKILKKRKVIQESRIK